MLARNISALNLVLSTPKARGGAVRAGLQFGKYLQEFIDVTNIKMKGKYDLELLKELEIRMSDIKFIDTKTHIKKVVELIPLVPERFTNSLIYADFNKLNIDKYDIIHIHNPHPFLAMEKIAKLCKKKGKPYIVTLHGLNSIIKMPKILNMSSVSKILFKTFIYSKYIKKVLNNAICLIALSKRDKMTVKKILPKKRVEVIPNGVPMDIIEKLMSRLDIVRKKYSITSENINLLFVGRIDESKGISILIKAVRKISYNFTLLIAGDFPHTSYKKYFLNQIKEDKRIRILGFVPWKDLIAIYRLADIFILPSYAESLPLSILEAMACKTPVIATNVGGVSEIVEKSTGIIIPPGDINALRHAIIMLIEDEKLRKKMAENAYKLAREKFDWRVIALKAVKIYKSILDQLY